MLTRRRLLTLVIFSLSQGVTASDSDFDGVDDKLDLCPNTAQLKKVPEDYIYSAAIDSARLLPGKNAFPVDSNGCEPDTDGDGVKDSQDYCKEDSVVSLSKGVAINGCPKHSDADGTPDYRDYCPNTPAGVKVNKLGCPI